MAVRYGSKQWRERISKALKGRPFSPTHLAALRAANSRPRSAEHRRKLGACHRGKSSWNKGLKGSVPGFSSDPVIEAERRRKISSHHKGRKQLWCTGAQHWRWKGGHPQGYGHKFRSMRPLILERDGYCCVKCGSKSRLVVHHINHNAHYNTFRNLVTLCHPCNVRAEAIANRITWARELRAYTLSRSAKYL